MMNQFRGHHLTSSSDKRDKHHEYSTYPCPESHRNWRNNTDVGSWHKPGSTYKKWHNEQETEDPDGQLYNLEEEEEKKEDPELARKLKELQSIEEQIMIKKASLALKNVDNKMALSRCNEEESDHIEKNLSLKARVNLILQKRYGHKVPLTKNKKGSSVTLQHDHPLKHRVQAALQQRFAKPGKRGTPFVSTTPPRHEVTPTEKAGNQGFMRFLNILNKGVDIYELQKIVNDDSELVPHSHQNGAETSVLSSPPPAVKKNKEEELRNADEQQKQLQNVLESLGLSLEMDEMSRLTDRTQERLYGKKQKVREEEKSEQKTKEDKTQTDSEGQQQGVEKYSPGQNTRSSSCSSADLSSHSSSRPLSGNLTTFRCSPSSPQTQKSSHSPQRQKSPSSSQEQKSSHSPQRQRSPSSSQGKRRSCSPQRQRSPSSSKEQKRSHSPYRQRSKSSSQEQRNSQSLHRRRSPSSSQGKRSSRSPQRRRSPSSHSPQRQRSPSPSHRQRSSHSPQQQRSPDTSNHSQSHLHNQTLSPPQPYAYLLSQHHSTHPPNQMYPAFPPFYNDPHYLQYTAYQNYLANSAYYWACNQPSTSNTFNNPIESTTISTIISNNQINPDNNKSQQRLLPEKGSRCLVPLKKVKFSDVVTDPEFFRQLRKVNRKLKRKRLKSKERRKEMKRNMLEKDKATDGLAPVTEELATEFSKSLTNLDGENTLGDFSGLIANIKERTSNIQAQAESESQLLVNDTKLPRQCAVTADSTAAVKGTNTEISTEPGGEPAVSVQEPEERPRLTEEEIKANLKKKLEAFNNRKNKNVIQPATSMTPQSLKFEDDI